MSHSSLQYPRDLICSHCQVTSLSRCWLIRPIQPRIVWKPKECSFPVWVGWLGTRLHSYQDISCGQVVIVRKSLSDMTLCYNWYLVLVVNDGSCSDQLLNNVSVAIFSSNPQRYCLVNLWRMGGGENAVMVEWNNSTEKIIRDKTKYWQRYLLYYHQDKKRDYSVTSELVFYELVIGFLSNKLCHQNTNLPLLQHSERNSCRKVLLSHRWCGDIHFQPRSDKSS